MYKDLFERFIYGQNFFGLPTLISLYSLAIFFFIKRKSSFQVRSLLLLYTGSLSILFIVQRLVKVTLSNKSKAFNPIFETVNSIFLLIEFFVLASIVTTGVAGTKGLKLPKLLTIIMCVPCMAAIGAYFSASTPKFTIPVLSEYLASLEFLVLLLLCLLRFQIAYKRSEQLDLKKTMLILAIFTYSLFAASIFSVSQFLFKNYPAYAMALHLIYYLSLILLCTAMAYYAQKESQLIQGRLKAEAMTPSTS